MYNNTVKRRIVLEERLQKFLARAGIASRRASERLILEGRVKVNGRTVKELGIKIDPSKDEVWVDGKVCRIKSNYVYIVLNKPKGYVTTVKDPFGRLTVMDLLKGFKHRVYPVGRLDKDTEGLLILTNDGEVAYRLTHPKHEVDKTYLAHVEGHVTESELKKLNKGIMLKDGMTAPSKSRILKFSQKGTLLEIKIHEGRKRQVRRMCLAIGHPVVHLKRIAIGKITLAGLKPGQWRFMTEPEVEYIKSL